MMLHWIVRSSICYVFSLLVLVCIFAHLPCIRISPSMLMLQSIKILTYAGEITAPIQTFFIGHSSVSFWWYIQSTYLKSYLMHSEPVLILRSVSRLTSLQTWFKMHSEPFFSYFSGTLTSYIWVVNLHRKVPLFIHLVWASSSRSAVISGDTMWQTWLIWSPFLDVATWSLPSRKSSVIHNVFYFSRELFFLTYER
jgi:hypothetical protein